MENYDKDLEQLIENSIKEHIGGLEEVWNKKILKLEGVAISKIKGIPNNRNLYSGSLIEVQPEGDFRFMEKLDGGSRPVTMGFWVQKMKIRFIGEDENFIIEDFGNFVPLR